MSSSSSVADSTAASSASSASSSAASSSSSSSSAASASGASTSAHSASLSLMPDDYDETLLAENPIDKANLFSRLTFWWLNPLVALGYQRPLEYRDLYKVRPGMNSRASSSYLESLWAEEQKKEKPSFPKVYLRMLGRPFVIAGFLKLINDVLIFAAPLLLEQILLTLEDETRPQEWGYYFAVAMLVANQLLVIAINQYFFRAMTQGIYVRTAVTAIVYRKSLRLCTSARNKFGSGKIVNMMSIDADMLNLVVQYGHMLWSGILQILVCIFLLWRNIGILPTLAGLAVMLLLVPFQAQMTKILASLRAKIVVLTDERIKLMNEILHGIRVIKFYAWEKPYLKRTMDVRDRELNVLLKQLIIRTLNGAIVFASPALVAAAAFSVYSLQGEELTASKIFPALTIFNIIRYPLTFLPLMITSLLNAVVAGRRIQELLEAEEVHSSVADREVDDEGVLKIGGEIVKPGKVPIKIKGTFSWGQGLGDKDTDKSGEKDKKKADASSSSSSSSSSSGDDGGDKDANPEGRTTADFRLHDIDLKINKGDLVAVVGAVGSGKSSLLSAILGEMDTLEGSAEIKGSLAYVSQQSWIINATLRENVTFGGLLDQDRYTEAVHVSALDKDIEMLPGRDKTEIGEKGINLSGGQKQRVSVARAVYADADIYLLDDPLSAVDSYVGRFLFDECINGALEDKTRILVTHHLQHLSKCDRVLVIREGTIAEDGTYDELMDDEDGILYNLVQEHGGESSESSSSDDDSEEGDRIRAAIKANQVAAIGASLNDGKAGSSTKGALMVQEERNTGSVKAAVYKTYVKSFGNNTWLPFIGVLFWFATSQAIRAVNDWWLAYWSEETAKPEPEHETEWYLGIFVGLSLGQVLLSYVRSLTVAIGARHASRRLHNEMLKRIVRAPMALFDTTPIGRIVNRFSKDLDQIDNQMPQVFEQYLMSIFMLIGTFIIIGVVTPYFLVCIPVIMPVYWSIQQYYRRTSRELKRLDSISRSPVYAHFAESLAGTDTIRAYGASSRFMAESERKVDLNTRAGYMQIAIVRWLDVRLQSCGNMVVFAATLVAVASRGNLDPALAGLTISSALNLTAFMNWAVRTATETETLMNAVERCEHYIEVDTEAPDVIPDKKPDESWPKNGKIVLRNMSMRYRPGLPLVLRDINIKIEGGHRVGLVGRTGSGKSSILQCLLRIIEPQPGSQIEIDGVDVLSIGLDDLRSKIAVIPQDPVLFSGTFRSNLDPFDYHSDEELWKVLDTVNLHKICSSLSDPIEENGDNLSVGQRQLLCLGRALLRNSKIIILDEATASVDVETDAQIQRTIRSAFSNATIITVAHRLQTVADYNKILVLDDGRVREYDSPSELLSDPGSMFSGMVNELGGNMASFLRKIAEGDVDVVDAITGAAEAGSSTGTSSDSSSS